MVERGHTFDWLKEVPRNSKPSIVTVLRLGSKSHRGTIASSSPGILVICATGMPRQTNENLLYH